MFNWPLTPPTSLTLLVSLILAISPALVHWVPLAVPHLHSGFTVLMLSYLVLLAGNVFRGLWEPSDAFISDDWSCGVGAAHVRFGSEADAVAIV